MSFSLKFHIKTALCSGVLGSLFQLNYNKNHSFGQNCLNGYKIGFLLGWVWPVIPLVAPIFAYGYVEHYIDGVDDIERLLAIANPDSDRPTWLDISLAEKKRMELLKDDERMLKGADKRKKWEDVEEDKGDI